METKYWIYVGAGSAGFVLASSVMIIICYMNYRTKKQKEYEDLYEEEVFKRYRKCCVSSRSSSKSDSFIANEKTYEDVPDVGDSIIPIDSSTIEFHLPQPASTHKITDLSNPEQLGKLNPNIYKRDLTSEQYAIAHSSHTHLGWIEFSTTFDSLTNSLMVSVLRVTSLTARKLLDDRQEKRNVFVSIYLYPDNIPHQTKVKKNTLAPVYNECFVFKLKHDNNSLVNRSLILSVYDQDKDHIRYALGHVQINLGDLDMSHEHTHKLGLEFYSQISGTSEIGEIELELNYLADKEKLRLEIVQCRDLVCHRPDDNTSNLFIRANLMSKTKIKKTRDTAIQPTSESPIFQEILSFSVNRRHLDQTYLIVYIMRRHSRQNIVSVGMVTLGPFLYAKREGLLHWRQMLDSPNESIKMWHPLKSPESEIVNK